MMTYSITKASGEIDWTSVPVIPIDKVLWSDDVGIRAQGQVCYNNDSMFVHQSAVEEHIRSEQTKPFSPVYNDSCMEFFFMHKGDAGYFNFEINPNGCIYMEYGPSVADRECITVPDVDSFFDIHPGRTEDGWEVFYMIPLDFLRSYDPNFRFSGGLTANMYKCGNKTVNRHFLSWTPIDLPRPNFHCPEYFGKMRYE